MRYNYARANACMHAITGYELTGACDCNTPCNAPSGPCICGMASNTHTCSLSTMEASAGVQRENARTQARHIRKAGMMEFQLQIFPLKI